MTDELQKDQIEDPISPPDPRAAGVTVPQKTEDDAVDEIEREELSANVDSQIDQESVPEEPTRVVQPEKHGLFHFLQTRKFWIRFIGLLIVASIFAWLITPSRDWLLNTLGQRAAITIGTTVATAQGVPPTLKNATVAINGQTYHTDDHGNLKLSVPFGSKHIVVSKQGYTTATKDVTVDFDPFFYKFGGRAEDDATRNLSFSLASVGITLQFTAKDWLSGDPITFGDFSVGDVAAQPDTNGVVNLQIPATDDKGVTLTAKFNGKTYTDSSLTFGLDKPTGQTLTFVPAGKDYFISKRTGQFGVYSANLDGSQQNLVVASNSYETGDIAFSASPSGKYGVLASVRDATHDSFGTTEQKLYLVNLASNTLTPLDTALTFDLVDWSGDTLVYNAKQHDTTGATTQRLASINATTATKTDLASAAVITVARVSLTGVVYLTGTHELHTVHVGGGADKLLGQNVQQLTQTAATVFAYQTSDNAWHQYNVNNNQNGTATTPTSTSRAFLGYTSNDGQMWLATDTVDGKLSLITKRLAGGNEVTVYAGNDLAHPVKWIQNVVVYHAGNADWAVPRDGGSPKKITDTETLQPEPHDYFDFN